MAPIVEWFEMKQEDFRVPFLLNGPSHAHLIFVDTMNIGVAYRQLGEYLWAAKYYESTVDIKSFVSS